SSVSFWRVWGKPRKRQLRWIGFPHEGQPTVAYYDRGIEQVNKKEASETEEYDLVYLHFKRQCPIRMGRFLSLGLVKKAMFKNQKKDDVDDLAKDLFLYCNSDEEK
ncbi:hypothetical protein DAPPUDRAFT_122574, partial [Daphnia pulex]